MNTTMSRREAFAGIAVAGATGMLPIAAAAVAKPLEVEDTSTEDNEWQEGHDVALHEMAEAWVNRWQALGGSFTLSYNMDGTPRSLMRGAPMSYTWTPPTIEEALEHGRTLRPHEVILEPKDFDGAHKMLESFLTLVPGLSDAVHNLASMMVLAGTPKAQRMDVAAFLASRRKEG